MDQILKWRRETYPMLPPGYITENGRACDDVVGRTGGWTIPDRVRYLEGHLRGFGALVTDQHSRDGR